MFHVIKTEVPDPSQAQFRFVRQKTMYGGKKIAAGDVAFIFASENEGGSGLCARGIVTAAEAVPRRPGVERQTPRVNVTVKRTALAKRPLGRRELTSSAGAESPAGEIHFKFYRQATDKIGSISEAAARFLERYF